MKKLLLVLLVSLFVLSGCGGNNNPPGTNSQSQGTLTLNIHQSGVKSQTIEPGLDMNIASFDIAGSGPDGTSFHKNNVSANNAPVTINALAAGNWTVSVDAKNAAGIIIASGVANIVVAAGVSTPVEITVKPLAGNGALEVGISWPAGIISNPIVNGTLAPMGGMPMSISFTPAADGLSATYQNPALPAGYYTLLVQLKDGATVKWGAIESVRIIAGQTSSGAFPLTANPGSIGDIELIINPDLQNPITITFSGQQDVIPVGSEMTVSATTSEPVDGYQWYINGTLLHGETGSVITIGSSLAPGIYRLDLVVTKGNIVSTGYIVFMVGNAPITISKVLAGGYRHSLFLKNDGTVLAWGWNIWGQLGNGTTIDSALPVPVNNLTDIIAIAGGHRHSLALKSDGTVWAWGTNTFGQLGTGTSSMIPVQVGGLTDVIAIAAGEWHSLALKSDGTVWLWGMILYRAENDIETTSVPIQVGNLADIVAIAAGREHSLALKRDGTVWAWGINGYGQLGNGTTDASILPVPVSNLNNVTAIAAGYFSSLALKNDGTVWKWGGTSPTNTHPLPEQASITNVIAIAEGDGQSLAVKSDGTLWSWGRNDYGQLGNGTTSVYSYGNTSPTQVCNLTNVTSIALGGLWHSLAMTGDGKVWAWGCNLYGELGNGTTTDSNIPVMVSGI